MIGIVTSFFDIGRGEWGGPHYLKRTTDEYFRRFERLLRLDNPIVVFTSTDLVNRFDPYEKSNLYVIPVDDWRNLYPQIRKNVATIQSTQHFQDLIIPEQRVNPEYWNTDYVMVNYLKSYFVTDAIDSGYFKDCEMVAWVDFGYARLDNEVPEGLWDYDYDPKKIHLFTIKQNVPTYMNIYDIISHNNVFIMGCHIVASKENWLFLDSQIYNQMTYLNEFGLIDDDQTLLYMAYCKNPSKYQIHYIDETHGGWFQLFLIRKYL